jgi:hypothetical protein
LSLDISFSSEPEDSDSDYKPDDSEISSSDDMDIDENHMGDDLIEDKVMDSEDDDMDINKSFEK